MFSGMPDYQVMYQHSSVYAILDEQPQYNDWQKDDKQQ